MLKHVFVSHIENGFRSEVNRSTDGCVGSNTLFQGQGRIDCRRVEKARPNRFYWSCT